MFFIYFYELNLVRNVFILYDMIQRIQTMYLSLVTILSLLLVKGEFMKFTDDTGSVITITFNSMMKGNGNSDTELIQSLPAISVLIILLLAVPFITVFLFKKRKIQLALSKIIIVAAVVLVLTCCYYAFYVISTYNAQLLPVLKTVLPLFILVFSFLAYRGIKKDDDLVKSYDRLR